MRTTVPVALAATALLLLAGCTAPGGGAGPDPAPEAEAEAEAETPCIVGTWQLDVADYGAQSEAWLLSIGMPIISFEMTGAGTITFTEDGLVAYEGDLTTGMTLDAIDRTPFVEGRGASSATGDWSPGSDDTSIDLANWSNVPDESVTSNPDAPVVTIDYTDIPSVGVACTATDLVLTSPESPFAPLWHR